MKHLLNDMSFEERQNIREQHEGGMSIDTSKFRKLMESKLGNVKPLITEALAAHAGEIQKFLQLNQDNTLVADSKFGDKSAIASAKYLFKGTKIPAYDTVTTVKTLWDVMLANKLDVGDTPGFGPKMANALAVALESSKTAIGSVTTTTTTFIPVSTAVDTSAVYSNEFYNNNLNKNPFKLPSNV